MRSRLARAAVLLLLLLPLAAASCSKSKSNPTGSNPTGSTELSGSLAASNGLYSHRFFTAGSYPYHCTIHSGMHGTVTVSAAAPASDSVQAVLVSGFTFTPGTVTVPVGGVVTWTNTDPANHTVTSD